MNFTNYYFTERKKDIEAVELSSSLFQNISKKVQNKKNAIFNFKMKIKDKILKGINLEKLFPGNGHVSNLNLMFVPPDTIRGRAKRTSTKDGRQFILIKTDFDTEKENLNFPESLKQFQNELENKKDIFTHEFSHYFNNLLTKGKSSIKQPYGIESDEDLNRYVNGHEEINSWIRQALSTIVPKYKKNPEFYKDFNTFYSVVTDNLNSINIKGKSVWERLTDESKKKINKRIGTIYLDLKNSLT